MDSSHSSERKVHWLESMRFIKDLFDLLFYGMHLIGVSPRKLPECAVNVLPDF
jgi:hypothetical protein